MNDIFNLSGRTALVTGSSQGIGRATALLLASRGARVIVNWRSNDAEAASVLKALEEAGAQFLAWKYDLASPSVKEDFSAFAARSGAFPDILVLNASVQLRSSWEDINAADFDLQMHTNLRSSLALIQACVPAMRERKWGRIVTIGSVQQRRPNTAMAVYAASKAAQANLVMTLCTQLAADGITVNNLSPGCIATGRNAAALADAQYRAKIEASIPAGFIGESSDVAPAILLLCSEQGRYITGTDIAVDGGMSIPFTSAK